MWGGSSRIQIVGYPGGTLVTQLRFIRSSVGTGFQDGALVGSGPHNIHNTVLCNLVPWYCASTCSFIVWTSCIGYVDLVKAFKLSVRWILGSCLDDPAKAKQIRERCQSKWYILVIFLVVKICPGLQKKKLKKE